MYFFIFQNPLSYIELFEMKDLAYIQSFLELDVRLSPMLTQPASWYQGLMKILMAKYSDRYKLFSSSDNNNQHLLILHPRFLDGFVMLSLDLNNNVGVSIQNLYYSHFIIVFIILS